MSNVIQFPVYNIPDSLIIRRMQDELLAEAISLVPEFLKAVNEINIRYGLTNKE